MRTNIIAEIGVSHGGSMDVAKWLMHAARDAGADFLKFQAFDADRLDPPGPRRDMLRDWQFSREQFLELAAYGRSMHKMPPLAVTAWDVETVKFAAEDLAAPFLKIASGNLTNYKLIDAAVDRFTHVLVSTGASTQSDIDAAVARYARRVVFMHCVSSYPTALCDVHIEWLRSLVEAGRTAGISDHSKSTVVPAIAVSHGATWVEKHIRAADGGAPDGKVALVHTAFRRMVSMVREAEKFDGRQQGRWVLPCEMTTAQVFRERAEWRDAQGNG